MTDEEYIKTRMQIEADKNCLYHTDVKGTLLALLCIALIVAGAYFIYHIGG